MIISSDNVALQLGKLEQRLLLSNSHSELENILSQLHRLGPGKHYSNINSKWQIEKSYAFILDGMGNKKTQDMLFLLLVKAQHCTQIKVSYCLCFLNSRVLSVNYGVTAGLT